MVLRSSQPRNYRSVGDNGARLPRRQWSRTVCYAVRFCFCFLILHTLHAICQLSFLPFIPRTFLAKCMQNASASIAESALLFILYIFIHHFACLYFFASTNFLTHFACDLPTFFSFFYSTHFSCKVHAKCYRALHTWDAICQLSFLPFIPRTFLAKCMQNASASIAESALLFILYIFIHHFACLYFFASTNFLTHFACDLPTFFSFFYSTHFSCKVHAKCYRALHTWDAICQLSFLPFIPCTFLAKCMQNANTPITESVLLLILYYIFL